MASADRDRIAELESANARLRSALESSRRVGVAVGLVIGRMRARDEQSSGRTSSDDRFTRTIDEVRALLGEDFERLITEWADRFDGS